jgi:hypothetical protein
MRGLAVSALLAAALRTVHSSIFAAGGMWMMAVIVGGVVLLDVATRLRGRRAAAAATPERARLLAFAAATLVAYVGIAHEVVGTRLYPDGPALLGGPLGWHAVGIAGIVAGALLIAGTLGVLTVPLVPSALSIAGRRRPLRRLGCLERRLPLLRDDAGHRRERPGARRAPAEGHGGGAARGGRQDLRPGRVRAVRNPRAISATTSRTAASGSGASRIGRPRTR